MKIPKALGLALLFPLLSAPSSAYRIDPIENPLYSSNAWFKDLVLAPRRWLKQYPVLGGALLAQLLGDSGVASPNAFFYTALNPKFRAVTLIMKALCSLKISSLKTALTTGILAMVFSGIKNYIAYLWEIQRIKDDLNEVNEEKKLKIKFIEVNFRKDFIDSLGRSFFNGMIILQETSLIPYILAANTPPTGSLSSLGNLTAFLYFFLTKKRFYAFRVNFYYFAQMMPLSLFNFCFMTPFETPGAYLFKMLLKVFFMPAVVCFWPLFF